MGIFTQIKRNWCFSFLVLLASATHAQTTVNYSLNDLGYYTKFTDGSTSNAEIVGNQLKMYANGSGNKQVVVWRDFKTSGDNTGSVRALQVGDVFTLSVYCSSAYGQIGFSLNAGNLTGTWENRTANSRLYVREDGTNGSWYVNSAAGNQSLDAFTSSTGKDYVFKVYITSYTTCNVELTVNGTSTQWLNNLTMNGTAGVNITGFSLYLMDDWNGSSNADVYWKQTTEVQASTEVRLGYGLTSGSFTPGRIINGFEANSTSTVSVNNVLIGGSVGSKVAFNESTNNYYGSTTINTNANCELQVSNSLPGSVTINDGGSVTFNSATGASLIGGITINGFGQGGINGAIRNIGSAFATLIGPVTLASNSMIQSDGGGPINIFTSTLNLGSHTLTFSGTQSTYCSHVASGTGGIIKTGSGQLSFGNNNNYSGGTTIMEGTVIPLTFTAFGSGVITAPAGSNATLFTNYPFENPIIVSAGGKLTFTSFDLGLVTSVVSGSGSIGIDVPDRVVLAGTNPFSGTFNISKGTLLQGTGAPLGTAHINIGKNNAGIDQPHDATLKYGSISNNITVAENLGFHRDILSDFFESEISGTIQLNGNVRFGGIGNKLLTGVISGTGGIIATTGTTTLSAENTYSGDTVVENGAVLAFNSSSAIPLVSDLILNGGTLVTNGFSTSMNSLTIDGNATITLSPFLQYLIVGNSSEKVWSGSLIINGWNGPSSQFSPFGGHIIVGVGGLTNTQLEQITFQGYSGHAIILPSGELAPQAASLSIKLFIEGYYDSGLMRPVRFNQDGFSPITDVDYVRIELHSATPPYEIVNSAFALLKTDGTLDYGRVWLNGLYYIAVVGNNFITTWSADPVLFGTEPIVYDFTTAANKAYGSNMIELESSVFGFYSGDINQDEAIDASDAVDIVNDAENSAYGQLATDLNGDGAVDNTDLPFLENNSTNSIFCIKP